MDQLNLTPTPPVLDPTIGPQLFLFTETQTKMLVGMYSTLIGRLASFQFNDPPNDTLLIRQHAHMAGQKDMIHELLTFDSARLQEQQEAKEEATMQGPQDSNPF